MIDHGAFAALFHLHRRQLYAFCHKRLSHAQDAEDCAQEAFSRAWSSLRRGTEPEDFRPWLFTIAARVCHERYAERAKVTTALDADSTADIDLTVDRGASFEDELAERLDARVVASAMAGLDPTSRSIVELAHQRGLPIGQVARTLGLPPRQVEGSLFRTRRALRAELGSPVPEPAVASLPARTPRIR